MQANNYVQSQFRSTVMSATTDQQQVNAAKPKKPKYEGPPKCKWCESIDHKSFFCKEKPICQKCGKAGHTEETCWIIKKPFPLGQRIFNMRLQGKSVKFSVEDLKNHRDLLQSLGYHFHDRHEKETRYYEKAKERRAIKKAEEKAKKVDLPPPEEPQEEPSSDSMDVEMNNVSCRPGPLTKENHSKCNFLPIRVGNAKLPFMIDTGAELNLFPQKLLQLLSPSNTSTFTGFDDTFHIKGLGGKSNCIGTITITLDIDEIPYEIEFFVNSEVNLPILGLPGLKTLSAKVDVSSPALILPDSTVTLEQMPFNEVPLLAHVQEAEEKFSMSQIRAQVNPELPEGKSNEIIGLLLKYDSTWRKTSIGKCKILQHEIKTTCESPIKQGMRRYSEAQSTEIKRQVEDLLSVGAIKSSYSPWRSQIVMVSKKTGEWRMCIDYRKLNEVTVPDSYPLPVIEDLLDKLGGVEHVITLDLKAGFHQIRMKKEDAHKTAFATPTGLYEWNVMPFGLINAPATFQRMVNELLRDRLGNGVLVYIDDIVIYAKTWAQLMETLEWVLKKFSQNDVFINIRKCYFGHTEFEYLGATIKKGKVCPSKKSLETISRLTVPTDENQVRRFLGMVGYLRRFIPDFAVKVKPIQALITAETFHWSPDCQSSYDEMKSFISSASCSLYLPDPLLPFILDTDASGYAIGGVLQQYDGKECKVLQFASKKLTAAEAKWSIYELEAYAIVWSIFHFAHYLKGRKFTVRSDHQSLKWLWSAEKSRIARWAMFLQEFNFKIIYRAGNKQQHVDIFTRDVCFGDVDEVIEKKLEDVLCTVNTFMPRPGVNFPTVDEFVEALKEDNTYKKIPHRLQDDLIIVKGRIYVPQSLRQRILHVFHYSRSGGHQGVQRTYRRLNEKFWWNNMIQDIQQFNKQCLTCLRRQNPQHIVGEGNLLGHGMFELISVDTVGPVWFNKQQWYLFTCIDHLTKFPVVIPLKTIRGIDVWEAFYSNWISYFGAPRNLLADNAFDNQDFKSRVESLGTKCIFTLPYHPQGNGVVESFHQFLKKSISAFVSIETTWSFTDIVASTLLAFRSTPHPSTGDSPYRLLTGCDMVLPHFQNWTKFEDSHADVVARLMLVTNLRRDAFDNALQLLVRKKVTKTEEIKVGDVVIAVLKGKHQAQIQARFGTTKLMPMWTEPCRVTKFHGESLVITSMWHEGLIYTVPLSEVRKLIRFDPKFKSTVVNELNNDSIQHYDPVNNHALRRQNTPTPHPSHINKQTKKKRDIPKIRENNITTTRQIDRHLTQLSLTRKPWHLHVSLD